MRNAAQIPVARRRASAPMTYDSPPSHRPIKGVCRRECQSRAELRLSATHSSKGFNRLGLPAGSITHRTRPEPQGDGPIRSAWSIAAMDSVENDHMESFKGPLREAPQGGESFDSLHEARVSIERRRMDCHTKRPHRSLGFDHWLPRRSNPSRRGITLFAWDIRPRTTRWSAVVLYSGGEDSGSES